jgi:hypothetical protein
MKILHLTLTKKWFDRISSGEKLEEYREPKEYWAKRLWVRDPHFGLDGGYYREFDIVRFKNGYAKDAPTMDVECKGIEFGGGKREWGAEMYHNYFVIKLGKVLSISNYQTETA